MKPIIKDIQPFGCPVYVLDVNMASGKKRSKWSEKARCGIYLGQSLGRARNVALVLSLNTGMVIPQLHMAYNTFFEIIRKGKSLVDGLMPTKSNWQVRCGAVQYTEQPVSEESAEDVVYKLLPTCQVDNQADRETTSNNESLTLHQRIQDSYLPMEL